MKLIAALIFTALALQSQAAPQVLRVGTEGAYFPFNYLDEKGQVQGFDIDLSRALCAELKMECKFITQEWDGMIPALLANRFDIVVSGMAANEERRKKIDFTDVYFDSPIYFVTKKTATYTYTPEGLKGKSIGVQRGTTSSAFLEKKYPESKIKLYDTQEGANMDLKAGRIDIVLASSDVMSSWLQKPGNEAFGFVGPKLDTPENLPIFGDGANIALRKQDQDLKTKLNKALAALKANGTYDKIKKQYFKIDIK